MIHVEGRAAHSVGLEDTRAEVMDEPEGRYDEGGSTWELCTPVGCRIVPEEGVVRMRARRRGGTNLLEHEVGVQRKDDGIRVR